MIGNLIALFQLGGTIAFGDLIASRLIRKRHWLFSLGAGMAVISQLGYLITLFPTMFWVLEVIAWIMALGGIWIFYLVSRKRINLRFEKPRTFSSWIALFLSISYLLLAFCPPTQADALHYHWGVPIYLIQHHQWPPTDLWLHGSLAGIGEVYILLGLLLHAENLSTLLQAIGIVGFASFLAKEQKRDNSEFLKLFVLSSPVLLFFVTGPKPQLFPQIMTAMALYLSLKEKRIELSEYVMILILLSGAAQQKLSFILTGGTVGFWASYKVWITHPRTIFLALFVGIVFFGPRAWWNWQQAVEPEIFTLITPLPNDFTSRLHTFREQDWWFPFNLIFPDSFGSISAIIGVQILLIIFIKSKDKIWSEVTILTLIAMILTYIFGQSIARSFNEFVLWVSIGLALTKFRISFLNQFKIILNLQSVLTLSIALFGLFTLFPGVISKNLREKTLSKHAFGYQAINWANKTLPRNSVTISEFTSVAFFKHMFLPTDRSSLIFKSEKYNELLLSGTHLLSSSNINPGYLANKKFKLLKSINGLEHSTRNPFNSGSKYSAYLYKIENE